MGMDSRWFWVRNALSVGRNLALMARIGTAKAQAIIDRVSISGENLGQHSLVRELHMAVASFHFGLWEYLPQVFSRLGFRIRLVTGRQKDSRLGAMLAKVRGSSGVGLVRRLREALRGTSRPTITGFMLDNTSQGSVVWVESDGLRMRVPDLGFRLARRHGLAVVPMFSTLERGRLRIQVGPAGDEESAVEALLVHVREHPEEWVWWGKAGAIQG
jgi:lauroyl/myristoyl acyltransferase